jgi:hypothetical protein
LHSQEQTINKDDDSSPGHSISEIHQDLIDTKKRITDLIRYRKSLLLGNKKAGDQAHKFKEEVIDALNHLFDEESGSEAEQAAL